MINKESAFKEGFIKKAQEYGLSIKQGNYLFEKLAFGENTMNVFKNFTNSEGGKNLMDTAKQYSQSPLGLDDPARRDIVRPLQTALGEWSSKMGPWLKDRAVDYGVGAGGGGALAAGGGMVGGGLLGKGLGHFAGYLSGGATEEEKAEKKRSWGNIGAGVGALGGGLLGGVAAGLGGPLAGMWNTDRGMSALPELNVKQGNFGGDVAAWAGRTTADLMPAGNSMPSEVAAILSPGAGAGAGLIGGGLIGGGLGALNGSRNENGETQRLKNALKGAFWGGGIGTAAGGLAGGNVGLAIAAHPTAYYSGHIPGVIGNMVEEGARPFIEGARGAADTAKSMFKDLTR